MIDYRKKIGTEIRLQRKRMKLTQEAVAERLGISVKHLSEVERGIAGLSIENLVKCSETLHISLDSLIKGTKNGNRWSELLFALDEVPAEKEEALKKLIYTCLDLLR